jgi:hypothetical protein
MPSRRGLVSQFLRQCIDTWLGGIILLCDKPRRRCCALGPLGARSGVRVPNAPTCPITRESWKCRRGYPVCALWRSSPTSFRRAAQSPTSFAFQRASLPIFPLNASGFHFQARQPDGTMLQGRRYSLSSFQATMPDLRFCGSINTWPASAPFQRSLPHSARMLLPVVDCRERAYPALSPAQ